MVFEPPSWVPKLPTIPDSIPISEFTTTDKYGRYPLSKTRNPYTCGLTGKTFTVPETVSRHESLARSVAAHTGWAPERDTSWDKVACIFSLNTIDYMTIAYSIHRLNGIVTPANAAYSAAELAHQLTSSGAGCLFVCVPLLQTGLEAARKAGIPDDRVWIVGMPGKGNDSAEGFKSVEELMEEGRDKKKLAEVRWYKGQGKKQTAFLCYSSGTSGLPKAVMISHYNVIAATLQLLTSEIIGRKQKGVETQVVLGLLPLSHIYGLVSVAHTNVYRGDEVIILPRFEMSSYLNAIQRFKIEHLYLVPPLIIRMIKEQQECKKYNLDSVRWVYCGAAPLGQETVQELLSIWPKMAVGQGYGMTETSPGICSTAENDVMHRSSGYLLPATRAKVISSADGREIKEYDTPGELWVSTPSATLGYLNNQKATAETFVEDEDGRWVRTGDEVIITKAPSGNEHVVIVDRIKELIKVKGHQVAPAELEAHILSHPAAADCAVIQVPDDKSGEVPKAFVVKAEAYKDKPDDAVARDISKYVEKHKAHYKWITGGIEFLDIIPKSPSGKILRRMLRDREKEARRKRGPRL